MVLNSAEIEIQSVTYNDNGKVIEAESIKSDGENEISTITFPEKLPVGKSGFFHMEFQGIINDKLKGLYRSKYTG